MTESKRNYTPLIFVPLGALIISILLIFLKVSLPFVLGINLLLFIIGFFFVYKEVSNIRFNPIINTICRYGKKSFDLGLFEDATTKQINKQFKEEGCRICDCHNSGGITCVLDALPCKVKIFNENVFTRLWIRIKRIPKPKTIYDTFFDDEE